MNQSNTGFCALFVGCLLTTLTTGHLKRVNSTPDESIAATGDYQNKRACSWNEACKKEFQVQFECRCPRWSYCRGPGKYYNAYCSVTATGYVWAQRDPFYDAHPY